jgi:hypothetical protein
MTLKDELMKIFKNINGWIIFCDTKNAITLAFNGVLIGLFIAQLDYLRKLFYINNLAFIVFMLILWLVGTISIIITVYNLRSSILPRIHHKLTTNMLYYGDIYNIYKNDYNKYLTDMRNINEAKYEEEISKQIIINSEIASIKYQYSIRAINLSLINAVIIILLAIINITIIN